MSKIDQEAEFRKEVRHDVVNINYLLKTLSNILATIPNLPEQVDKILKGAINSTDKLITKVKEYKQSADEIDKKNNSSSDAQK